MRALLALLKTVPSVLRWLKHEANFLFGHRGFDHGNPYMGRRDRWLLRRHLRNCRFFVEFGSGGSTLCAVEVGVPSILSVEASPRWLAHVSGHPAIAKAIAEGHLSVRHVDIGPVSEWGYPMDESRWEHWPSYYRDVWGDVVPVGVPDVVLIDGCFRRLCAEAALPYISENTRLLVHDWRSRPEYHSIEKWYKVVGRLDELQVLRKLRE